MVSHPELGLDPPIGSDRESGCDRVEMKLTKNGVVCTQNRETGIFAVGGNFAT